MRKRSSQSESKRRGETRPTRSAVTTTAAFYKKKSAFGIRPKCSRKETGSRSSPFCSDDLASLELHTERELQLARMRRAIREWSVADRTILIKVAARRAPVDFVEDIVEICAELHSRNLMDQEVLLDCHVRVELMRTEDAVPSHISNLIQTGNREG